MLTLNDLMSSDTLTLDPEMTLRDAVEQLTSAGFSGAPVVSGKRLVGVVSTSDILNFQSSTPGVPSFQPDRQEWGEWDSADLLDEEVAEPPSAFFQGLWFDSEADLTQRIGSSDGPEWDLLAEHVVGEVMTRKVIALPPGTEVGEAARLMVGRQIHRLIVAEDDRLVGIVSAMDFVRAVAEEKIQPPA